MVDRDSASEDFARGVRLMVASADAGMRAWVQDGFPAHSTLCAVGDDGSVLAELARAERADVCLLDLRLPGALPAIGALIAAVPRLRIVAWAAMDDDPALVDAVHAGATGCIVGRPDRPAIARALADVTVGRPALPRALVARLVAQLRIA